MSVCSCHNEECLFCEAKLYAGLTEGQVCEIRGMLSRHVSDAHDVLFRSSEPSQYLFMIRSGQIKLTTSGIDGNEHIIGLVGAGYLLGFDNIGDAVHSYTAECLTPTVVCRIKHRDMMQVLAENPKVSLNVLQAMNEQLVQARSLIRVLGQKSSIEKLASFLLSLAPKRTDDMLEELLPLHLSRSEIAEVLGLTVETVSRIMARLQRDGIIDAPRGGIHIRDRNQLQMLAGSPLHLAPPNGVGGAARPRQTHNEDAAADPLTDSRYSYSLQEI
jgi:CRP/FNR family transcriptional regulator